MRKVLDFVVFKYIDLKLWLHRKKNGNQFDLFQFGMFWMLILILASWLLGKIL